MSPAGTGETVHVKDVLLNEAVAGRAAFHEFTGFALDWKAPVAVGALDKRQFGKLFDVELMAAATNHVFHDNSPVYL